MDLLAFILFFIFIYFLQHYYFLNLFIYLFIFGCIGSSLLCTGFLQLWQAGATLRCSVRASHCSGFSCCGAWALGAQAQQLWLAGSRAQAQQLWGTSLVAPQDIGSSRTRAQTHVPCIGRRILNHCATREVPSLLLKTALGQWLNIWERQLSAQ